MNAMQRGDERQPLSGKRYDACVNLSHGREIGRAFAGSLSLSMGAIPRRLRRIDKELLPKYPAPWGGDLLFRITHFIRTVTDRRKDARKRGGREAGGSRHVKILPIPNPLPKQGRTFAH